MADDVRDRARREVGSFLASRRARVLPADVGLPAGPRRRVPGLRREEVALLAGISVEYYARLERGLVGAVSDAVLASLAGVLRLGSVEEEHLRALVRAASGGAEATTPGTPQQVPPSLQALLGRMPSAAVFVRNARLDVLAHNQLFGQLYDEALESDGQNLVRYLFLDPRSRVFYRRWEQLARGAVGSLRADAARAPGDASIGALVAELTERSEDFRQAWAGHAVEVYDSGLQQFHHHAAGDLDLAYDTFEVVASPGLTMIAYHALPGTASEQALQALASRG